MFKKYSRMIMVSIICLSIMFSYQLVSAKETNSYFTNDNGVSLTEEEYNFLVKMYWDGYPKMMTQEEYQRFIDMDIIHREYNEKTVVDAPLTRGTFHSTGAKSISIATACSSSNCLVSVLTTWLGQPTIRSYDVMGCYLSNVSLKNTPSTRLSSTTSDSFPSNYQKFHTGFGNSFKLPGGSDIVINQDFITTLGGHIYASYQHAKEKTTLAVSKDYTLSRIGYGGVFEFGSSAKNIYDGMNGVDIAV